MSTDGLQIFTENANVCRSSQRSMTVFINFKNQSQRFMTIFGITYRYEKAEIP